ncbi:MAG: nucleotidyl transferase AbiEii/AbiGii toxin family protein [Planctomycetaceae bacterium]
MFPVDAFQKTIDKAGELFSRHNIRFHLTGGVTSVLFGEPRMTQDIDVVIDPVATANAVEELITSLGSSDFLFSAPAIRAAVHDGRMFQLFDQAETLKLDIYPRELIPGELDRSELVELFEGTRYPVTSPTDAAVSKLIWISKGSHKSRRDVRQIYQYVDSNHKKAIRALAEELNLSDLLDEVLVEPDEID